MKKIALSVIILLLCAYSGFSQSLKSFGIKGGLSISTQSYHYKQADLPGPENALRDLCIGGFAQWNGTGKLSWMLEMYYICKGASDKVTITMEDSPQPRGTTYWDYEIYYLSIPLLARLNMEKGPSRFYGLLGPRMDIRLGQNDLLIAYNVSSEQMQFLYKDYRDLDFGLEFGIGMERPVSSLFDLILEIRYSPSFTHVYQSDLLDIRNQSFEFLVGFNL